MFFGTLLSLRIIYTSTCHVIFPQTKIPRKYNVNNVPFRPISGQYLLVVITWLTVILLIQSQTTQHFLSHAVQVTSP